MGSDEPIATIGDAFDLVNGFAFKSADFVESGIPVIKIKNVKAGEFSEQTFSYVGEKFLDKRGDKLARIGDLLISMSGNRHDGSPHTWVGKVAYFNKPGRYFINQRVGALRPKQGVEVDLKFAAYVLASMSYQQHFIAVATSSGGQANLSPTQILGAPLSLPDYAEQHEIGRLISALDDRIDLLRQTNSTLEAIAQALFKSWFVDFDPVHAKAEGREPEAMDAATAALFPSEFEASELGPIPKGWCVRSVYDIASVRYGAPFASSKFNTEGNGLPLVRIRDLRAEQPGVWTQEVHPKGYLIQPGDIIVGMDGEFRAHLWGGEPAWMNQRVCVFHPIAPHCNVFVRNAIAAPLAQVEATETATTVIHLGKGDIDQFKVVAPSDEVAAAFAACSQPLYDKIVSAKQQARNLADLRDTLLPRLISGKLRLPEATKTAEAALA